jgi:nucleoside-diphosphate-sugar epimerase
MATIPVDLTDREATKSALQSAADTTHLFYAALSQDPDLAVEAKRNSAMLSSVLDGLEAAGAPLRRVVSYEGFKIYGIHLGAHVRTPARESDPPHMPPNIYLSQRAQLRAEGSKGAWDNVALSPDVVVDDIYGNPMNIALVVGTFAELSRELGVPMRFPGTDKAYRQLAQFTDAGLLARASLWAATNEKASGEVFNLTNGDVFRWERMWEDVARHLGLEVGPPVPLTLARHMADKGVVWRDLAERHGLHCSPPSTASNGRRSCLRLCSLLLGSPSRMSFLYKTIACVHDPRSPQALRESPHPSGGRPPTAKTALR